MDAEGRGKVALAISELNSTFVTFVRFQSEESPGTHGERKNSTIGITVTDNLCKPS